MKKNKLILPSLASLIGIASALATPLAPTFYVETSPSARTCVTVSSVSCTLGTAIRCAYLADPNDPTSVRWLTYKDPVEPNPTVCKPAFRP